MVTSEAAPRRVDSAASSPRRDRIPAAVRVAIAMAIVYECLVPLPAGPGRTVVKVSPIVTMALWALSRRGELPLLVGLSLLAHAVGDVLIELPRQRWLIPAMSGFLAGHLLYIVVFVREYRRRRSGTGATVVAALLLLNAVGYGGWLTTRLEGPLLVAVPMYIAALTAMAILAVRRDTGSLLPAVGALSFVLSDAMIAWRLFVMPEADWLAWLTWPTYAAAQMLIPLGLWVGRRRRQMS